MFIEKIQPNCSVASKYGMILKLLELCLLTY